MDAWHYWAVVKEDIRNGKVGVVCVGTITGDGYGKSCGYKIKPQKNGDPRFYIDQLCNGACPKCKKGSVRFYRV